MKQRTLVLITCLLTVTLGYSQNIYPKKIVLSSDTVVIITPLQLKSINQKLTERKILKESVSDIQTHYTQQNLYIKKMNTLSEDKTKLIIKQNQQIADLKNISDNADKNMELMRKEISNQKRKKFTSTIKWVGITMAATATVVSLIK